MQDYVFEGNEDMLEHIICVSSLYKNDDKEPLICYQSLGEINRQLKKRRFVVNCKTTII